MMDNALYRAILDRRSVRRYEGTPLDAVTLGQVRSLVEQVQPLVAENAWQVAFRDELAREDLRALLGAYGRILSAPHALVPWTQAVRHPLVDLGYRAEQVAVLLRTLDIGSCFVGTLLHEQQLGQRLALPAGARTGALLVFGHESERWAGQQANAALRAVVGARTKRRLEQMCFVGSFERPGLPPARIVPLLEAGRCAPSADNAQPWRFLWADGALYLYVTRRNLRYGIGALQEYRLFDGGVCMANIALAMRALEVTGGWRLDDGRMLECPEALEPMARLELG